MKNILVFSFFPINIPLSSGGEVRLYNVYKSLSRYYNITLLSSGEYNVANQTIIHSPNFVEKRISKDLNFIESWQYLESAKGNGDLSAPAVLHSAKKLTSFHKAYLDEYDNADIIIHDSPFTVDYDLFLGIDNKLRIYNSQNSESQLYNQLHSEEKSEEIRQIVCDAEKKLLKNVDIVFYCSVDDLDFFETVEPSISQKSIYVPNGLSSLSQQQGTFNLQNKSVVFIGSSHRPNVDAANYIVDVLSKDLPDVTFNVIGECLKLGKYPNNVIRHGKVSDEQKSKIINSSSLAINPVSWGSGSNVKMFDYFSYRKAVISTSFGARGIDIKDNQPFITAELDNFGQIINCWIDKQDELNEIGSKAYQFILDNYDWDRIIDKSIPELNRLIERKEENIKHCGSNIIVLNDYDFFSSNGGGGVRAKGIYQEVSQWNKVYFLYLNDFNELTVKQIGNQVLISLPKSIEHKQRQAFYNSRSHISVDDIIAIDSITNHSVFLTLYSILRKNAVITIIEHPYLVAVPLIFNDRFVYSSHNFEVGLKRSLLSTHRDSKKLISLVEQAETQALTKSILTIAVSDEDAENFTLRNGCSPIVTVANGALEPCLVDKKVQLDFHIDKKSVVFIGSSHIPNIESVIFISEILAPACPDIQFHIIGSVCDQIRKHQKNIILWGKVDEAKKALIMQSVSVAINPTCSGGGSNIKLADYFANGLYTITTSFGRRGYPDLPSKHIRVVEREGFISALQDVFSSADLSSESRNERYLIYKESLSMSSSGKAFLQALKQALYQPKKKILYVTYRYVNPILGGAESMLSHLISGLNDTGEFLIDVISPEISEIKDHCRFAAQYSFNKDFKAAIGLANVRYQRFELDSQGVNSHLLSKSWRIQSKFEEELFVRMLAQSGFNHNGLAWGWGEPEKCEDKVSRWMYESSAIYLTDDSNIFITGSAIQPVMLSIINSKNELIIQKEIKGDFSFEFQAMGGIVKFLISVQENWSTDYRPLGLYIHSVKIDEITLNLLSTMMINNISDPMSYIEALHAASENSRRLSNVLLSEVRGPFSSQLNLYVEEAIKEYDLVITHNSVFKTAVDAVNIANNNKIPVLMIPHAHLDDDFYHFPDVLDSVLNSTLIAAAPKAACEFYRKHSNNQVHYLPAGIDTSEKFTTDDIDEFKKIYQSEDPFILVLGRKAKSKGYDGIINVVDKINEKRNLKVVMIGPDDDGAQIISNNVIYLGRQSRNIVRGALMSCQLLVNMSESESFGIVILEAWLAKKAVVVNKNCLAFSDLVINGENGLLATTDTLEEEINRILDDAQLASALGEMGFSVAQKYDWAQVKNQFIDLCHLAIGYKKH